MNFNDLIAHWKQILAATQLLKVGAENYGSIVSQDPLVRELSITNPINLKNGSSYLKSYTYNDDVVLVLDALPIFA